MSQFGLKAKRAGVFGMKKVKRGVHGLKNGGKHTADAPSMKKIMGGRKTGGIHKSIEKM